MLMSTNASTWFYNPPENRAYLIGERLNGTFWQSRIVNVYWHCVEAEAPFLARGYLEDGRGIELSWEPGKWLALKSPEGYDPTELVTAISKRVLARPAAISFVDVDGNLIHEWHTDGGKKRWAEIQGKANFQNPQHLTA